MNLRKIRNFFIKHTLNWLLVIYSLLVVLVISLAYVHYVIEENLDRDLNRIRRLEVRFNSAYTAQIDFLHFEANNDAFYKSGESQYFKYGMNRLDRIDKLISDIKSDALLLDDTLLDEFAVYCSDMRVLFTDLKNTLLIRGYMDWGLIGEMRHYAYLLEQSPVVDTAKVLSLRRHEEDYIIRSDPAYIEHFYLASDALAQSIHVQSSNKPVQVDEAAMLLSQYRSKFDELLLIDEKLGYRNNDYAGGIKGRLNENFDIIQDKYEEIKDQAKLLEDQGISFIETIYLVLVVIIIVVSVYMGFFMARNINFPILKLSEHLGRFVENGFVADKKLKTSSSMPVIDELCDNVETLKNEITQKIELLQNEKEKAKKSDQLKSAFLANMSHEIRTPMNAIIGFTSILMEENSLPKTDKEYLNHIRSHGNNLLNIIDDIVDISKIEADVISLSKHHFDVNAMLNEIYLWVTNHVATQPIEVKLKVPSQFMDRPHVIVTDENRLKQILNNLMTNAIKFTAEGAIEIGYSLKEETEIEFFVKDSGIGIANDKQELIFERFGQAEKSHATDLGGTGLGLTISKRLVEMLGGEMRLDSQLGSGASFYFTLPYEYLGDIENELDTDQPTFRSVEGLFILVAEDTNINYVVLERMLDQTGVHLERANNGKELLATLSERERLPDIILMDLRMPEMDGFDATLQVKQLYPQIPVIAQTASVMGEEIERSKECGFDGFITKPYIKEYILEVISKWTPANLAS